VRTVLISLLKRVSLVSALIALLGLSALLTPGSAPTVPAGRPKPTPTPTPTPTPPPGIPVPVSIASDCSVDITAALNAFIASVPDGNTVVFAADGCYRLEQQLLLDQRTNLVLDGNGAELRRTLATPPELQYPTGNRHINVWGGSGITIRDLKITGTNTVPDKRAGFGSYLPPYEFDHAIALQGVTGATIQDVTIDAVWGDGIFMGQGPTAGTSNVAATNVSIDRNGRQGVSFSRVAGVVLDNVQLLHSRRSGFDFEPAGPGASVSNVEIRNSYVKAFLKQVAGGGLGDVYDIFFHNNTIADSSAPVIEILGPEASDRHGWRFYDNFSPNTLGYNEAMHFANVDDIDIQRNVFHLSTKGSRESVQFDNAHGALFVIDNDFLGACAPYVANNSDPVIASGNILSIC
jgi:hypothetical protein